MSGVIVAAAGTGILELIDTNLVHDICLYILYASAVLLTFVIVERLVYYMICWWRLGALGSVVHGTQIVHGAALPTPVPERLLKRRDRILARRDTISHSIASYVAAANQPGAQRAYLEDLSAAHYIKVDANISARLWLLDTVVTAAPLLGLLGTILGIMDTFSALSAGGISDPGAVSRGIGAALLATAIGIGVALYGLLGHNVLHRIADHLLEEFKRIILLVERMQKAPETA